MSSKSSKDLGVPFFDALGDLLAQYADVGAEDLIATIETHLEGLRDQFEQEEIERRRDSDPDDDMRR
jgi:hypothetical protein